MKNILRCLSIAILVINWSCEKDNSFDDFENNLEHKKGINLNKKGLVKGSEELIILYPLGTTDIEKQQKRTEYGITDYKQCECADENLELWIFDANTSGNINIEEKKETATVDEEIEGADFNPIINIPQDAVAFNPTSIGTVSNALDKVVNFNQGVTVAVLDTGINYNYEGFSNAFLYNSDLDACTVNNSEELFGWNFVENNNNPYDNHPSMHGTVVSHIITSKLDDNNTAYQLLPVKIANANGSINYFDALCGFQYATKKNNIKIINMSFGWYNSGYELLERFVTNVQDEILVVCSAGNNTSDNDQYPHYPSSYESENILSIAGLSGDPTINNGNGILDFGDNGLAYFSNYGSNSVDVAAISEDIRFEYDYEIYYYDGTSFSAAYATAYSAILYQNGMTAQALKNQVIGTSIYAQNLHKIKYSAYIDID